MRLSEGDFVTGVTIVEKDSDLLVITEGGYGKRMEYTEFAAKGRGGRGMTYLKITDKNGSSVGISSIKETDEVIIIAQSGMIIRVEAKDISKIGRSTQGVRVVNLKEEDSVIDFAVLEGSKFKNRSGKSNNNDCSRVDFCELIFRKSRGYLPFCVVTSILSFGLIFFFYQIWLS